MQLRASGERERELQRCLTQATLHLEVLQEEVDRHSTAAATPAGGLLDGAEAAAGIPEEVARVLVQQHDAMSAALRDTQQELAVKVLQLQQLRQHQQQQQHQQHQQHQQLTATAQPGAGRMAADGALSGATSPLPDLPGSLGSGASFWLGPAASPADGTEARISMEASAAQAAATAAAASPDGLRRSPASPRSTRTLPPGQELSRLARRSPSPGGCSPSPLHALVAIAEGQSPATARCEPGADLEQLQAALTSAELQNDRLRGIVAAMRAEMEGATQQQVYQQQGQEDVGTPSLASAGDSAAAAVATLLGEQDVPIDAALLRAELAASDDELAHALQHVAVLQNQLQHAGAPGAAAGQLADELQYLRQVSGVWAELWQGGILYNPPAAAPAGASSRLTPTLPSPHLCTLIPLPQRTTVLMADNRRLRRVAMEARLDSAAALGLQPAVDGASSLALPHTAPSPPPDASPLAGRLQLGPSAHAAASPSGAPQADEQAAEPLSAPPPRQQELQDQQAAAVQAAQQAAAGVQHARQQVGAMQSENERLMEMSNALRSERDRLLMQLQAMQVQALHACGLADGPQEQQALALAGALAGALPAGTTLGPYMQQGLPSPPVCMGMPASPARQLPALPGAWALGPWGAPQPSPLQPPPAIYGAASLSPGWRYAGGEHTAAGQQGEASAGQQQWQPPQSQPPQQQPWQQMGPQSSTQHAGGAGHTGQARGQGVEQAAPSSVRQSVQPQAAAATGAGTSSAPPELVVHAMQPMRPSGSGRGGSGPASSEQAASADAALACAPGAGPRERRSSSGSDRPGRHSSRPRQQQQQRAEQEQEEEHTAPAVGASARETASQRATLHALQRRRSQAEAGSTPAAAAAAAGTGGAAARLRVRNYNIVDDGDAQHQQLGGEG